MDRRYISYLLRLWMVKENDAFIWRASLEETHSGERYGFANLDAMLSFLKEKTQESGKYFKTPPETADE